jgi:hypothetical protein
MTGRTRPARPFPRIRGCGRLAARLGAEELRDILARRGRVVEDVRALGRERGGREDRRGRPLDVVPARDAVDTGETPVGEERIGPGRRDHRQRDLLVDLRGGHGDPPVQVADDRQDLLAGHDALRVRHGHVGAPLIIECGELHPEPQALERPAELLEGELGAEPDLVPARRFRSSALSGLCVAIRMVTRLWAAPVDGSAHARRVRRAATRGRSAIAARPAGQSPDSRNVVE